MAFDCSESLRERIVERTFASVSGSDRVVDEFKRDSSKLDDEIIFPLFRLDRIGDGKKKQEFDRSLDHPMARYFVRCDLYRSLRFRPPRRSLTTN